MEKQDTGRVLRNSILKINMWNNIKKIQSTDENVSKFVFEAKDAIVESVLYKYPTYEDRTVICCSTQSGCPVGCRFCFLPDEEVETTLGKKPIQSLKKGDVVLSYDFNEKKLNTSTINTLFSSQYYGEIITIYLKNNESIKVTADHEIYLMSGEIVQAKDLKESDEIFSL